MGNGDENDESTYDDAMKRKNRTLYNRRCRCLDLLRDLVCEHAVSRLIHR